MIDKFKRGKHIYTHWDKNTKHVTTIPKKKQASSPAPSLSVEVPPECEDGVRADMFVVHHTAEEFVLDGVRVNQQAGKGKVRSRVTMSPKTAKRLLRSLEKDSA